MATGNKNGNYLRIGTTYYKKVHKPLASGDKMEMLVPWTIECIKCRE